MWVESIFMKWKMWIYHSVNGTQSIVKIINIVLDIVFQVWVGILEKRLRNGWLHSKIQMSTTPVCSGSIFVWRFKSQHFVNRQHFPFTLKLYEQIIYSLKQAANEEVNFSVVSINTIANSIGPSSRPTNDMRLDFRNLQ